MALARRRPGQQSPRHGTQTKALSAISKTRHPRDTPTSNPHDTAPSTRHAHQQSQWHSAAHATHADPPSSAFPRADMHPESHACHANRMSQHVISRVRATRPDASSHGTTPPTRPATHPRHARSMTKMCTAPRADAQTRSTPAACHANATKMCTAPHAQARSARGTTATARASLRAGFPHRAAADTARSTPTAPAISDPRSLHAKRTFSLRARNTPRTQSPQHGAAARLRHTRACGAVRWNAVAGCGNRRRACRVRCLWRCAMGIAGGRVALRCAITIASGGVLCCGAVPWGLLVGVSRGWCCAMRIAGRREPLDLPSHKQRRPSQAKPGFAQLSSPKGKTARSSIHATPPSTFASKAPGLFARLLCSDSGLALPVRCAFGAITCNIKHEQSTSELCRKRQRSRVVERNPNGNLTLTPPYSAKTPTRSGTKWWRHVFQPVPPLDSYSARNRSSGVGSKLNNSVCLIRASSSSTVPAKQF